jgi:hypothetical protein
MRTILLKLYLGIIMNNSCSIKSTSREDLPSLPNSEHFPYDGNGNLSVQYKGGIYTGKTFNIGICIEEPSEHDCIKDVQLSVNGNDESLLINVIFNSIDIENSVTVSFKSYFSELFSADSQTPLCLVEAESFLDSLYLDHNQKVMIQALLYGLVGSLLFHNVTKSSAVAVALIKSMVKRDKWIAITSQKAALQPI